MNVDRVCLSTAQLKVYAASVGPAKTVPIRRYISFRSSSFVSRIQPMTTGKNKRKFREDVLIALGKVSLFGVLLPFSHLTKGLSTST